jgi:hypothetical protein
LLEEIAVARKIAGSLPKHGKNQAIWQTWKTPMSLIPVGLSLLSTI